MMEGTTSVLSDPIRPKPPLASTDSTKPPRRPRKVKATTEQTGAPRAISKPIDGNFAPASTHIQNDATPGKIDKSVLTISEPRRLRDKAHLKFVASQPCLVCGGSPADAHHLWFTQPERWAARSATNSLYLYAEPISETTTTPATKSPVGRGGLLIPSPRLGCSGLRRGVSNEGRIKSRLLPVGPRSPAARITPRITGPTVGDNARRPCKFQSRGVSIH
jgi:hypothetical protein